MVHWTDFGVNKTSGFSARRRNEFPPPVQALIDELAVGMTEPLIGLTTDGTVRKGLYALEPPGGSTAPITEAAHAFLEALDVDRRTRAVFPLDADERRTWLNIHPNVFRHGVMLEDLSQHQRELGLSLLRATLSHRGFAQARDIMRLNELLVHLSDSPDEFGEWPYFVSIFGDPASGEPWAWQVDGHHLCLNCTVIGDQMVLTPTFMGSEPCHVYAGPFAGTTVVAAEERAGLDLMRSLDDASAATAILRPSIHPDDWPPELQHRCARPHARRCVSGQRQDRLRGRRRGGPQRRPAKAAAVAHLHVRGLDQRRPCGPVDAKSRRAPRRDVLLLDGRH